MPASFIWLSSTFSGISRSGLIERHTKIMAAGCRLVRKRRCQGLWSVDAAHAAVYRVLPCPVRMRSGIKYGEIWRPGIRWAGLSFDCFLRFKSLHDWCFTEILSPMPLSIELISLYKVLEYLNSAMCCCNWCSSLGSFRKWATQRNRFFQHVFIVWVIIDVVENSWLHQWN